MQFHASAKDLYRYNLNKNETIDGIFSLFSINEPKTMCHYIETVKSKAEYNNETRNKKAKKHMPRLSKKVPSKSWRCGRRCKKFWPRFGFIIMENSKAA